MKHRILIVGGNSFVGNHLLSTLKKTLSSFEIRIVTRWLSGIGVGEVEVGVFSESVKVVGNVLLNSEIPYQSGRGFNYYINAVGGTDFKGWKQRAYIIYPNGKAAVAKNFLFFRSYPKVMPGSQIVIPEKPEKPKTNTTEIISIASVLASLAGVIIAIIRR